MRNLSLRRLLAATIAAGLALAVPSTLATADGSSTSTPPAEFGTDWDDPRTADPDVVTPSTRRCSVTVVDHEFRNFDVVKRSFTPPAGCAGPWSKVVLRLDGAVKGRQFDRLGWVDVNGVRVLTLSTPEPSVAGITWHVEKDVTSLAPALRSEGESAAYIGNVVNDTYTGVLDVTVTLDFYTTGRGAGPADTADLVVPLADSRRVDGDLAGTLTTPRNTKRLLADVYATGSGGGCEEFWDTSTPPSTGYWCPDGLPYREVDVVIDGQVAGVALPYPVVYTGGWSNPFLWYAIPSPNAFDIPPLRYDLTPFAGMLNDGRAHDVRIHVEGVAPGETAWTLSPAFHIWTDDDRDVVPGGLVSTSAPAPDIDAEVEGHDDLTGSVRMTASRTFAATGWLETSGGRVTTTVERRLDNDNDHSWTDHEEHDEIDATWTDAATTVTTGSNGKTTRTGQTLTYSKRGFVDFVEREAAPGTYDVTTTLDIGYGSHDTAGGFGVPPLDRRLSDTFSGTAHWIYGVPRDQRHATATTNQHYRLTGDPEFPCYDRTLTAVNGYFTVDSRSC